MIADLSRHGQRTFRPIFTNGRLYRLVEAQTAREIAVLDKFRGLASDLDKQAFEKSLDRDRERLDAFSAAQAEELRIFTEKNAKMEANAKERQAIEFGAFQIVGQAGIDAFAALAKGQKVSLAEVLSGIGDTMVAEGSRWLFTGLARTFLGDPSGPGLVGIGAAEIAAGVALGAATSSSAGAAGGGGSSAVEPTRIRQPGDAGGTTVVSVSMPTVIRPTFEDGRNVRRALREMDIHEGAA